MQGPQKPEPGAVQTSGQVVMCSQNEKLSACAVKVNVLVSLFSCRQPSRMSYGERKQNSLYFKATLSRVFLKFDEISLSPFNYECYKKG